MWVQCHKELSQDDRTWTKLKKALLRWYRERPDLAQAEWRVMQRTMMPGETLADFAAGLRDAAGQNRLWASSIVAKREPAQTAVRMDGTKGAMQSIPGLGSIPADAEDDEAMESAEAGKNRVFVTNPQGIFDKNTNVWVASSGRTWNGRYWRLNKKERGRERKAAAQDQRSTNKRHSGKPEKKMKVLMVAAEEDLSGNEE
ncbi:hypothetical protein PI126_g17817 [Phytophthora idaei]|nr:hypothetical protein PI126_g17817 [Phytophthora idaei]